MDAAPAQSVAERAGSTIRIVFAPTVVKQVESILFVVSALTVGEKAARIILTVFVQSVVERDSFSQHLFCMHGANM
jgi:hypothetical protein